MTVVGFLDIYYCVIIAWTFFYLFATFTALPGLPWATCGNSYSFSIRCPTFPPPSLFLTFLVQIWFYPSSACENVVKLFSIDRDLV